MNSSAWSCSLGAIALWALFAALVRNVGSVPPLLLTGLALCIGSMASIHRWTHWRVPARTFLFGTAGLFIYHACLVGAFSLAPIAEANLINYLWPMLIVLLAARAGIPLRRKQLMGCGIAFAGCALAIAPSAAPSSWSAIQWLGYGMAAMAALTWAFYSLGQKWFPPYSSWATGGFCLAAGLLSLLAHLLFEARYIPNTAEVGWIAAIGIGPLGVSFVLWDVALRRGDPARIGALSYSTPILSMLALGMTGAILPDAWLRLGVALALVIAGVRMSR
jgi:drug/metabolite transporter (DMT)-like permease